jgi:hypothetical protein
VSYPKPPPEHEFEATPGLPEALPEGEHILWQGQPDRRALASSVFYLPAVGLYFLVMLAARAWWLLQEPIGTLAFAKAFAPALFLSALGYGLIAGLAWFSWSTTLYTLTNRRVVMRIGIVLTVTFNIPLRSVVAADWAQKKSGNPRSIGDIALQLDAKSKIAYFHLWPHARPWKLQHPQPMLRRIANSERVAGLLAQAWQLERGQVTTNSRSLEVPKPEATHDRRLIPTGS